MSSRKSKLRKITRSVIRREKKQAAQRQRVGQIKGETEEQELARKTRDLSNWLEMVKEREQDDILPETTDETKEN